MGNINWALGLVSVAAGILVGMIVLVVGMWIDARRARLDQAAERLAHMADAADTAGAALQALRPLPRRTPGASLNDDSGA